MVLLRSRAADRQAHAGQRPGHRGRCAAPRSPLLLDIGCGEGWLVRALKEHVPERNGVDAVPELIEQAEAAGGGAFRLASYDEPARSEPSDCLGLAMCNISLFGQSSVEQLLAAHPSFLRPAGVLLVQTLHPLETCGSLRYRDGWRERSWEGFDAGFVDPAPWNFRTLESSTALFRVSGVRLLQIREPLHPRTGQTRLGALFEAMTASQRQPPGCPAVQYGYPPTATAQPS
jgi:SAM-dependent methyltransferase